MTGKPGRTGAASLVRRLVVAATLWLAALPSAQPLLQAVALATVGSVVATEAEARSRSSGGYSRPSSGRTPSFSPGSSSSRRPSTSGGYTRPSAPVYVPRNQPAQSGADRAMQRGGALDALNIFRGGSRPDSGAGAGSRGAITLPQGPLVRDRTPSTRREPTYSFRGGSPPADAGRWQPPAYAQGGRFGAWDGILLWYLLDTLNRPGHARAFHDNRDDPGVRSWRAEADQRAASDPALKAKLDELDRETAALQGEAPQPGRLPPDVARATDAAGDDGSGFGGLLVTVLLLGGFAFITWRFFRRRRAAGAATAAKGANMGPIDTARGILRRKMEGEPYKPSFFRVGMTFPFDPTPFLMAEGVTKVTQPPGGEGNALVSVAAVGRIDAGEVAMHRLYLAGSDGWFQLWLDEDGRPEECRWFQPIDEVHPADSEEWAFWMDEREGMVGWPEFQTKDGQTYARHWLPGDRRVDPRQWTETIEDARGTRTRQVHAMLYARSTGAAAPAPEAEYLLVSVIEGDGEAFVEIAAGIDVNPAALTIA
ncbi:hypothetical protein STVA_35410 [Allostella vacuolata]|nr:hypothetical protein STVA_35410 [Stella vacuolata]